MTLVKEILDRKDVKVWTIAPDATVLDALELMAEKDIGALVVMENDVLVGIMSERDYARKIVLKGKVSKDTPVREIMSAHVYCIRHDTTIEECMTLMTEKRFRHLPVCKDGKLSGFVSIGDIVNTIISQQKIKIEHLEGYIMGKYPG